MAAATKYVAAIDHGEFLIGTVKPNEWGAVDLAYTIFAAFELLPPILMLFSATMLLICIRLHLRAVAKARCRS